MTKNVSNVALRFWPCAVHWAVDMLNNAPNSSGFTPKEIFTGAKWDRSFKNFCTFGSPIFVVDSTIQKGHKFCTWLPRSIPSAFVGKSREHVSNASLFWNPATNHVSPQFNMVHGDDFRIVSWSCSNSSPSNWREVFQTDHWRDDSSFSTPL